MDSILGMAMDNASNNDTMLKELPNILPAHVSVGTEYQIRCFGHIINLVCKAFLSLFDTSKKALKAHARATIELYDDDEEESDDEEDFEEDEEVVEDQEGERDTGDWEEIEELSRELVEVTALDDIDRVAGRTTMKKAGLFVSLFFCLH